MKAFQFNGVEVGNAITIDLGDIDEAYYSDMERLYEQACLIVGELPDGHEKGNLTARLCRVKRDTSQIGWGYGDEISDIYQRCFENQP